MFISQSFGDWGPVLTILKGARGHGDSLCLWSFDLERRMGLMRLAAAFAGLLVAAAPVANAAQDKSTAKDKYAITDQEKAACTADAMRLCLNAYPNEDRLLSCLKRNRASLTPTCLVVFDAGVRRRHL